MVKSFAGLVLIGSLGLHQREDQLLIEFRLRLKQLDHLGTKLYFLGIVDFNMVSVIREEL